MNKKQPKIVKEKLSFYQSLPRVNFFQYPPMGQVISKNSPFDFEKLALNQKATSELPFTIFIFIPYCLSHCNSCVYFKALLPSIKSKKQILNEGLDNFRAVFL